MIMKRFRAWWRESRWFVIAALWLAALTLGYAGFDRHCTIHGQSCSPWDILYLTFQLIPLNSGAVPGPVPWQLELARLFVPALTLYAAAAAFALLFRKQVQLLRLRFVRDHVVVCGAGHAGWRLIQGFRRRGDRVVVIERDEGNDWLDLCRSLGAIVLTDDATSQEALHRAGVHRARWLVAVCGHDGTNAEIAVRAREVSLRRPRHALTCAVQIGDPALCELLRQWEFGAETSPTFRLELFNLYDRGARSLLQEFPAFDQAEQGSRPPHLVVVGLGSLGESLVIQAAKAWRAMRRSSEERLRISVVDRDAPGKCSALAVRYPTLASVADLEALQHEVDSAEFQAAAFLGLGQGQLAADIVYVCLDDDDLALRAGLLLQRRLQARRIPVVVRMAEVTGLGVLLEDGRRTAARNLHPFGLLDRTCTPDLVLEGTHEMLARELHADYMRRQMQAGDTPQTNPVLVPWDRLGADTKESNRQQVDHIGAELKAVGCGVVPQTDWDAPACEFTPEEVEVMARMEHDLWCEERRREGYTFALGPKDPEGKTHPDLVSWEVLPEPERDKNRAVVRDLPRFLAQAGFQVVRW